MAIMAKRFSIQAFDNAHYRTTEQYTRAVDALFDFATKAISQAVANGKYDPDKPFSFDDYPSVRAVMQDVTKQLANRLTTTIETGARKQWLFACKKNDGFIASIMDTSKLSKARLNKMQDQNLDALKTFQGRKVEGMNLSERVWKYTQQYKEQIEIGLDVGLGEGRSAQQLSRDLRQNLRDPNRLFRRVRDKRGNLVLSKAAKAFHPGRGVYRSSVKNAQRLTRSEINMAYRESDWRRWQQLDFVVGFEVRRSNHEPLCECKTCERLVGRYPKTFKFKGWHPQCMCYAIPILMDEETFDDNELGDLKAALRGTTYKAKEAKNAVIDVPDSFKEWVKEHEEAQKNWGSTPYFIKDNFKDGKLSEGLKITLPTVQVQTDVLAPYMAQIEQARQQATKWGLSVQLTMLDKYVADKHISSIQSRVATIQSKAMQMEQADADIRRKCAEWGLNTYPLDEAMRNPDSKNILAKMAELETRVFDAEKEYKQFISDANKAVIEARKCKGIDISGMLADIATITGDKREWFMAKASYKKALQDFLDKISNARGTTPTSRQMPDELKAKSAYLNGEDYTFDKDFFDLIDPNKPIRLEILDSDSGSYSSYGGDLVHIAGKKRNANSSWETKAVIYHEYGHCIDAQRALWMDSKLIDMRNAQIKMLKKKGEYTIYERKWNHNGGGWYHERVTKTMSMVEYIDTKLQQLQEKILGMKEDVFQKRGITKWDAIEQIGSTRDTIKSLVVKYGSGHTTSYFKKTRMSETEYLAHAFENTFLGNRVFQKYLPDIYNEMIAYIRALKPI
ncbi:hypothetical protein [Bacteroides pyogenes]|uniref:hypothetical protein n=1 Tax=Bacteroides pyogenes TaxID=310300 RepID=UPI001F48BCB7|nr:hypothetical protein [Bacteroides pyogenes]MCF2708157.1 hypothetical protein [Bacteroides pyogenes]